jgi:hypothetical protein
MRVKYTGNPRDSERGMRAYQCDPIGLNSHE